ncbi:MAG: thioredoxin domain-containing protein [Candidatus Paceibacterota bacterium]
MLKKHLWKIIIAGVVILLAGSIAYSQYVGKQADEGVVATPHIKGNPEASVTLVEYSDFQCPACAQFYPYIKDLVDEYNDSLRFEYRHFPLVNIHPQATPAARAAEAASQQGKFWEMHDKLFEEQNVWSKAANPSAYFNQYAEEIGLDTNLFKRHLNSSILHDVVNEGFNDARDRGFTGTPTFLLNDQLMEFTTFDEFRAAIVAAIEENEEIPSN